jgi:hypothetical protein
VLLPQGSGYAKPYSMLGLGSTDGGHTFVPSTGPLVCSGNTTLFPGIGPNGAGTTGCPDGAAVDDGKGGVHMVFDWSTGLGAHGWV